MPCNSAGQGFFQHCNVFKCCLATRYTKALWRSLPTYGFVVISLQSSTRTLRCKILREKIRLALSNNCHLTMSEQTFVQLYYHAFSYMVKASFSGENQAVRLRATASCYSLPSTTPAEYLRCPTTRNSTQHTTNSVKALVRL